MKRALLATVALAGAVALGAPAYATPFSLTDTWTEGAITHLTGSASNEPTLTTNGTGTSNDGFVTPVGNPHTQTLALGTPVSNWLFVAVPGGGTTSADIAVNFTLSDGTGGTASFTAYMDYYANVGTDTDDMAWTSTAAATPGYLAPGTASLVLNETLSDGAVVQVTLPYETDWDMAQKVTYDLIADPTAVPEPASLALLGTGMFGLGLLGRRKRRLV
jgi:hypothetical protein